MNGKITSKVFHFKELRIIILSPTIEGDDERSKFLSFVAQRGIKEVLFVGCPRPESVAQRMTIIRYGQGEQKKLIMPRWKHLGYLSYLIDWVVALWLLITSGHRFDLYFGFGVSYASLGLILRYIGIVKRVVFWTTDYFPLGPTSNRFIKWIYNKIHRICVESSDYLWDVSLRIKEARRARGWKIKEERVIIVPYMLSRDEIEALPIEQVDKYGVIQLGLMSDSEFTFLLEAIKMVSAKIPQVKVTIVSYGTIPQTWLITIKEHGLMSNFHILGYIEDGKEVSRIIQRHRAGIAIYPPGSHKKYGDPARVKTYLAKGVPVIITRVPSIWEEVANYEAGITIDYDPKQLAEAIAQLLIDDWFYTKCRENALRLASRYEAEAVFNNAFQRMHIILDDGER